MSGYAIRLPNHPLVDVLSLPTLWNNVITSIVYISLSTQGTCGSFLVCVCQEVGMLCLIVALLHDMRNSQTLSKMKFSTLLGI